jgi:ABC-type nitrate/sulfonate/bicarbonate transport system substrate-binding protein
MIISLNAHEIDIGIGLTEGWIAGLIGKQQLQNLTGKKDGGYKIVGQWVDTPLRWAIVTGRKRREIESVLDLKGKRVGVSRLGR